MAKGGIDIISILNVTYRYYIDIEYCISILYRYRMLHIDIISISNVKYRYYIDIECNISILYRYRMLHNDTSIYRYIEIISIYRYYSEQWGDSLLVFYPSCGVQSVDVTWRQNGLTCLIRISGNLGS